MILRRVVPLTLVALLAIVVAIVASSRDDGYSVHIPMDDAAGLRNGSKVTMGGVEIGKVGLAIGDDDRVDLELEIEEDYAPLPRDARISVVASNLLGQKQVEIVGGDRAKTAPDGARLARGRVSVGTDLDQVLNVLDADTRTRLAIVLNEAGTAVAGRKTDIAHILDALPTAFSKATTTVQQLVKDNRKLGAALATTDSFIAEATARREALRQVVDRLGGATGALAARRRELRGTLATAPGALGQLRAFLDDLRETTKPLSPAAREITASAPLLDDLLAQIEPLRRAADPTLRTATKVAPDLTRLATRATPVVRRAVPTAGSLARLAQALPPLSSALDKSSDNLLATADNWTRAIQFRDGLSHVFRGEASMSPDLVLSAIKRLAPDPRKRKKGKQSLPNGPLQLGERPAPGLERPKLPPLVKKTLDAITGGGDGPAGRAVDEVLDAVSGLLDPKRKAAGGAAPSTPSSPSMPQIESLLDFLLR